jgi:parvulin-like peptidyl-prolyl isomerase
MLITMGQGARQASDRQPDAHSRHGADPHASRRAGLLLFGVAFVALFAVVAVSEGLGDPEVPDGDVIYVEGAPGDRGNVSKAEFDHAFEVAAAQNQLNEVPKPGDPRYAEIKEWTVDRLIESIWIEGQAAEMGLSVSDRAFADEIRQIKNRNFPNEAEFEKFSEEQRFTLEDFRNRIKEQALSTKIRNKIVSEAQEPSDGEIEDYYEVAKARQFTRPPSRDVRLIRSQRRADAERAFAEVLGRHCDQRQGRPAAEPDRRDVARTARRGGVRQRRG